MTRSSGIAVLFCLPFAIWAQGGDKELRAQADALFAKGEYGAAFQPYQTLVGNNQQDFDLNFRYGVCALHGGADKEEAIKYLKRSTLGPSPDPRAWYFLGKAHHLSYQFKDALVAYERYRGTADKKMLAELPVDALELQCRNGQNLLSNLKEIDVHNKVEVDGNDFFRFYDLGSIGGKIVVTPEELKSSADRKSRDLALVYLPDKGGPIYFASYGKGGDTGRDIYRTELLPTGEFATPVKLAGYINTSQDEDFPFMAPDGKSFYFCSKGHNSMGGYDVFKSTYDKGLDVFGAPVNMDFAVNTPDDDLLYLTDPEGKEACFASARDSKQGTVHVYRVSTAQAPVNITVLKGTFASDLDANDRKAHIMVQDALTQETVSDVRTDMNGNYVLSLPRSGKYRFMVEAGPSAKTHMGVVDVPRNDEPRAYRQEMSLVDQGGEKLMIRNYFDQPLEEDMIALALDEIKRRAKLDVGTHAVVAEQPPAVQPKGDPITRAGFAGDVSRTDAQQMADADANSLRKQSDDLEHQSVAAYSIALENAGLAETHTTKAEELVSRAEKETDEQRKNQLMMEAARERQRARAANQRAIAALRAGEALADERTATQVRAQRAEKLSTDLTRVLSGTDENAMVIKLVELRTRMDEKNAPDGSITAAEKMRRMATEREKEAATAVQRANTARGEENELVDRIARKKREENEAKGNKKENLARERGDLETQLRAMRDENERAFAKAQVAEREVGNAKGQAALAKHLSTAAAGMTVSELNADQRGELSQRISGIGPRIGAIAVDERFDAAIAMEAREIERRTFDWGMPIDGGASEPVASTRTLERDTSGTARPAERTNTMVQQPGLAQGQLREGGAVEEPAPLTATGQGSDATQGAGIAAQARTAGQIDTTRTSVPADDASVSDHAPITDGGTINEQNGDATGTVERTSTSNNGTGQEKPATDGRASETSATVNGSQVRDREPVGVSRTDTDMASMRGAVTTPVEHDTTATEAGAGSGSGSEEGAIGETAHARPDPEELAFVQANELAELKQLRVAEKHRAQRDSLDTRIAELERTMRETAVAAQTGTAQETTSTDSERTAESSTEDRGTVSDGAANENAAAAATVPDNGTDTSSEQRGLTVDPTGQNAMSARNGQQESPPRADTPASSHVDQRSEVSGADQEAASDIPVADRPAMEFDATTSETDLINGVYSDYAANKERIARDMDDPKERSAALHGVELMLVDSIDAENARQLELLERWPDASAVVLKRVDRLREMKEAHVREAERVLSASEQEYAAGESRSMEDAALSRTTGRQDHADRPIAASTTPHNDDYVSIAPDPDQVYTSIMDHRTVKAMEAIHERDRDMDRLTDLEDRIDSLEGVLESMPMGKEQTRLRDATDKLIDDHMILRTEIGQRMGFITRKEFEAARDSSKELSSLNAAKGLPPNEPMALLATSFEEGAQHDMDQAARLRKQAERTEDIVLRDSLFRTAYAQELTALREMDRSHTVRNFIQSPEYVRGEQAAYEEVERRMFRAEEQPPVAEAMNIAERSGTGAVPANMPDSLGTTAEVAAAQEQQPGTIAAGGVQADPSAAQRVDGASAGDVANGRYKEFMNGETTAIPAQQAAPADASVLRSEARRAEERGQALEQASIAAADRANAYQDSAATAKRSDRDRLQRAALLARAESDSLHEASLRAGERAVDLDQQAATAQESGTFQDRLKKFYYLNDQEQALVVNEEDRSRYFQARAKALEQREEAVRDQEQAAATKQLADTLLQQSKEILANTNSNGTPLSTEQMEHARLLTDKAVVMNHRADSLQRASERLNMAAGVNESQAASMLQALTPERGTEIMAMEQRARRVEPLLAQARSLQGADNATLDRSGAEAHGEQGAGTTLAERTVSTGAGGNNNATDRTTSTIAERQAGTNGVPSGDQAASTQGTIAENMSSRSSSVHSSSMGPETRTGATPAPDAGAPRLLAPLTADVFSIGEDAAQRSGAIPMDQPMPAGVVYKVQVGAFKQDIPDDLFRDMTPVSGERVSNGLTRYTVGMFTSPEGAVQATRTVRERGYRDAFVVAYLDGRRVSLGQAMRAARPISATITADLPVSAPVRIAPPSIATTIATSDSAQAAEQAVLANYPASAEQLLAQFAPPADATAYYNVPGAAPARQVETVKGLFFTVQVGVYSKPTALDKLFNITPLNSERTENAKIRYTTGVFTDMEKARSRKDQTVTLGVKDAFITAYLNGKRIPMRDARALINKFGQSVFANPALITR